MKFEEMNGEEFEKFIAELFQKMGFRTQITNITGDGGIDIEARYDGMIFQGDYLIQCKRWSKKVGEPPVRDLYGVVKDRNVVKGFLITSTDFSAKARAFAEGKNIELINGQGIKEILYKMNMGEDMKFNPLYSKEVKGFLEQSNFNKELYLILAEQIDQNPDTEELYLRIFELLLNHAFNSGYIVKQNGLLQELEYFTDEYKKQFCNGKSNRIKSRRIGIQYIIAFILLMKGDLIKFYHTLSDLEDGYEFKEFFGVPFQEKGLPGNISSNLLWSYRTVLNYFEIYYPTKDFENNDLKKNLKLYFPLKISFHEGVNDAGIRLGTETISIEHFLELFEIKRDFEEKSNIFKMICNEKLYWRYRK
ncbi:restriction endonuclease [Oceanobacillus oncorhynchi]|uniref:restriction endonuclease n=1 Tax=Oceanobacillus oncorhynchi TaxID=545501 RepID=UPI0034D6D805